MIAQWTGVTQKTLPTGSAKTDQWKKVTRTHEDVVGEWVRRLVRDLVAPFYGSWDPHA
mgnify:CR=1 FL=1